MRRARALSENNREDEVEKKKRALVNTQRTQRRHSRFRRSNTFNYPLHRQFGFRHRRRDSFHLPMCVLAFSSLHTVRPLHSHRGEITPLALFPDSLIFPAFVLFSHMNEKCARRRRRPPSAVSVISIHRVSDKIFAIYEWISGSQTPTELCISTRTAPRTKVQSDFPFPIFRCARH